MEFILERLNRLGWVVILFSLILIFIGGLPNPIHVLFSLTDFNYIWIPTFMTISFIELFSEESLFNLNNIKMLFKNFILMSIFFIVLMIIGAFCLKVLNVFLFVKIFFTKELLFTRVNILIMFLIMNLLDFFINSIADIEN